eukprot:1457461-Rhodomonas_salina.1
MACANPEPRQHDKLVTKTSWRDPAEVARWLRTVLRAQSPNCLISAHIDALFQPVQPRANVHQTGATKKLCFGGGGSAMPFCSFLTTSHAAARPGSAEAQPDP